MMASSSIAEWDMPPTSVAFRMLAEFLEAAAGPALAPPKCTSVRFFDGSGGGRELTFGGAECEVMVGAVSAGNGGTLIGRPAGRGGTDGGCFNGARCSGSAGIPTAVGTVAGSPEVSGLEASARSRSPIASASEGAGFTSVGKSSGTAAGGRTDSTVFSISGSSGLVTITGGGGEEPACGGCEIFVGDAT